MKTRKVQQQDALQVGAELAQAEVKASRKKRIQTVCGSYRFRFALFQLLQGTSPESLPEKLQETLALAITEGNVEIYQDGRVRFLNQQALCEAMRFRVSTGRRGRPKKEKQPVLLGKLLSA